MVRPVTELGIEPTPSDVDSWFTDAGFTRIRVGSSFQKRDLYIYHLNSKKDNNNEYDEGKENENSSREQQKETVLFLSLVHGNEPLGLITLLQTAEEVLEMYQDRWEEEEQNQNRKLQRLKKRTKTNSNVKQLPNIIFFPVINIDAYSLNLQVGSGCRRSNLNPTQCGSNPLETNINIPLDQTAPKCPELARYGVDLNRNFPVGWGQGGTLCWGHNYAGSEPFSEPETRAIRDVVKEYNVKASISFHSRARGGRKSPALLIHPYCTDKLISTMNPIDERRFRSWSRIMNHNPRMYITGTAMEAINYNANGASIDWFYQSFNITAFVHEASTPCDQRWCYPPEYQNKIHQRATKYAQAGIKLIRLVSGEKIPIRPIWFDIIIWIITIFTIAIVIRRILLRRRSWWVAQNATCCFPKQKGEEELDIEEEEQGLIEMQ